MIEISTVVIVLFIIFRFIYRLITRHDEKKAYDDISLKYEIIKEGLQKLYDDGVITEAFFIQYAGERPEQRAGTRSQPVNDAPKAEKTASPNDEPDEEEALEGDQPDESPESESEEAPPEKETDPLASEIDQMLSGDEETPEEDRETETGEPQAANEDLEEEAPQSESEEPEKEDLQTDDRAAAKESHEETGDESEIKEKAPRDHLPMILWIGVLLVSIACISYVTASWNRFSAGSRFITVLIPCAVFFLLSRICYRRMGLLHTSSAFYMLGAVAFSALIFSLKFLGFGISDGAIGLLGFLALLTLTFSVAWGYRIFHVSAFKWVSYLIGYGALTALSFILFSDSVCCLYLPAVAALVLQALILCKPDLMGESERKVQWLNFHLHLAYAVILGCDVLCKRGTLLVIPLLFSYAVFLYLGIRRAYRASTSILFLLLWGFIESMFLGTNGGEISTLLWAAHLCLYLPMIAIEHCAGKQEQKVNALVYFTEALLCSGIILYLFWNCVLENLHLPLCALFLLMPMVYFAVIALRKPAWPRGFLLFWMIFFGLACQPVLFCDPPIRDISLITPYLFLAIALILYGILPERLDKGQHRDRIFAVQLGLFLELGAILPYLLDLGSISTAGKLVALVLRMALLLGITLFAFYHCRRLGLPYAPHVQRYIGYLLATALWYHLLSLYETGNPFIGGRPFFSLMLITTALLFSALMYRKVDPALCPAQMPIHHWISAAGFCFAYEYTLRFADNFWRSPLMAVVACVLFTAVLVYLCYRLRSFYSDHPHIYLRSAVVLFVVCSVITANDHPYLALLPMMVTAICVFLDYRQCFNIKRWRIWASSKAILIAAVLALNIYLLYCADWFFDCPALSRSNLISATGFFWVALILYLPIDPRFVHALRPIQHLISAFCFFRSYCFTLETVSSQFTHSAITAIACALWTGLLVFLCYRLRSFYADYRQTHLRIAILLFGAIAFYIAQYWPYIALIPTVVAAICVILDYKESFRTERWLNRAVSKGLFTLAVLMISYHLLYCCSLFFNLPALMELAPAVSFADLGILLLYKSADHLFKRWQFLRQLLGALAFLLAFYSFIPALNQFAGIFPSKNGPLYILCAAFAICVFYYAFRKTWDEESTPSERLHVAAIQLSLVSLRMFWLNEKLTLAMMGLVLVLCAIDWRRSSLKESNLRKQISCLCFAFALGLTALYGYLTLTSADVTGRKWMMQLALLIPVIVDVLIAAFLAYEERKYGGQSPRPYRIPGYVCCALSAAITLSVFWFTPIRPRVWVYGIGLLAMLTALFALSHTPKYRMGFLPALAAWCFLTEVLGAALSKLGPWSDFTPYALSALGLFLLSRFWERPYKGYAPMRAIWILSAIPLLAYHGPLHSLAHLLGALVFCSNLLQYLCEKGQSTLDRTLITLSAGLFTLAIAYKYAVTSVALSLLSAFKPELLTLLLTGVALALAHLCWKKNGNALAATHVILFTGLLALTLFACGVFGRGDMLMHSILTSLLCLVLIGIGFKKGQNRFIVFAALSLICMIVVHSFAFFQSLDWWIYLAITGLALIVLAFAHEMERRKGSSLRQRFMQTRLAKQRW